MPKVLLKRFHNKYNRFFYYDIEKQVIGNNGTSKSINTQLGYYSQLTEDYFRDNIETPFGEVLTYIEKTGIDRETFTICSSAKQIIKNFIFALVARGPSFSNQMNEEEDFWQAFPPQFQHDFIAKTGIRIAQENDLLSEYIVTFMLNKTSIPFVLSMDGIYNYTLNGYSVINLPIFPNVTVSLVHESYSSRVIHKDNSVLMYEIIRPEDIMLMNERTFSTQLKRKWGYVICSEKDELSRLVDKYC